MRSTKWNSEHPERRQYYRDQMWINNPQAMIDKYAILRTYSPYEFHLMIPDEIKEMILKEI